MSAPNATVLRTLRFLQVDPAKEFPCPKGCKHSAYDYLEAAFNAYAASIIDTEIKKFEEEKGAAAYGNFEGSDGGPLPGKATH